MTRTLRTLPVLAVLAAAACEPVPAPAPSPDPTEDACGASGLQGLVGQPEGALEGLALAQPVRIYNQGDALTMDFNPSRLNVELGPDGTILRVYCG